MTKIQRNEVVQGVLDLYQDPSYLEIGVSEGVTFHGLSAAKKVAVDPLFRFDVPAAQAANPEAAYHQVTSDEYFGTIVGEVEKFDVIYVDGLHTFDQTLRDFINALAHLNEGGVIVIDDVLPTNYTASIRDLRIVNILRERGVAPGGAWMGDVYRLVFFIETFFQSHTYRTIKDNHGQLVVWAKPRPKVNDVTAEHISRLPYETVLLHRQSFQFAPFSSILEEVVPFVKERSSKAK